MRWQFSWEVRGVTRNYMVFLGLTPHCCCWPEKVLCGQRSDRKLYGFPWPNTTLLLLTREGFVWSEECLETIWFSLAYHHTAAADQRRFCVVRGVTGNWMVFLGLSPHCCYWPEKVLCGQMSDRKLDGFPWPSTTLLLLTREGFEWSEEWQETMVFLGLTPRCCCWPEKVLCGQRSDRKLDDFPWPNTTLLTRDFERSEEWQETGWFSLA